MKRWISQIDTDTIRWDNSGGNTMLLSAQLWQKCVDPLNHPYEAEAVRQLWVVAGPEGVGFYDTVLHPFFEDDSDAEPVVYFDWEDTKQYKEDEYGREYIDYDVPAEYYRPFVAMTAMYDGFMMTNDYCNGF